VVTHPDFAQRPSLIFQPLAMAFHVPEPHLFQRLLVDHAGGRQPFEIVERHDVQCRVRGVGQCGSPIEGRAVFHQGRDDQHET
jgi:hypothetical protein